MFRSYLLTAWRTMRRDRAFTAISILGLAVGLACCILMLLYAQHELNYDTHYANSDRLYQVYMAGGEAGRGTYVQYSIVKALQIGDAEDVVRAAGYNGSAGETSLYFSHNDVQYSESYMAVSSDFFDLLDREFIDGQPAVALTEPGGVVLAASLATQLFGSDRAVGRTLIAKNGTLLTVTAVVADAPENSHLQARMFLNFTGWIAVRFGDARRDPDLQWVDGAILEVAPSANLPDITFRLNEAYRALPIYPRLESRNQWVSMRTLPDIHLDQIAIQILDPEGQATLTLSNRDMVVISGALSLLVLAIGIINFVNMMIARASQRQREISTRKALGATRDQLFVQYLSEAFLISSIAVLAALPLTFLALPGFNVLVDRSLSIVSLIEPGMFALVVALNVLVGLAAGTLPALALSRLPPVASQLTPKGGGRLRQGLVLGQFFIASLLIVLALTARGQVGLMRNLDFGYDHHIFDGTMELTSFNAWSLRSEGRGVARHAWNRLATTLQRELARQTAIETASVATDSFLIAPGGPTEMTLVGGVKEHYVEIGAMTAVDANFLDVYRLPLVAGRNFESQRGGDVTRVTVHMAADGTRWERIEVSAGALLITESAARALGFDSPEAAIGARLRYNAERMVDIGVASNNPEYRVIGVTGDMLVGDGLSGTMAGSFLHPMERSFRWYLRAEKGSSAELIQQAKAVFAEVAPDLIIELQYRPDTMARILRPFERLMIGFIGYALIAITISCFGLYAMTAFVIGRRKKEVGVRKVLGATNSQLMRLLISDLLKPVLTALVFALPSGYVLSNYLLESFITRVSAGPSILGSTIVMTLLITAATVSGQTWKLASTCPSDLLLHE